MTKLWALALFVLSVAPVDAYVKSWPTPATPAEALRRLERRADSCPSDRPVSCKAVDSQLPDDFCCGSDTTCISLDKSSTALCCPKGSSCDTIQPITCDISAQNASSSQGGTVYTTKLDGTLQQCGSQCCPFGYICSKNGNQDVCAIDKSTSGSATTTRTTSTTTSTTTAAPTSAVTGIDSTDPPPSKSNTSFSVGSWFAGFFPGLVVGILATLAWVVLTKRHKKSQDTRGLNTQGHGGRPFISKPLMNERNSNERSDFLSRTRSRARSMFSTHRRSRTVDSIAFWDTAKMPTPPTNTNVPVNYVNDMPDVPVTPARRVARFPSDDGFVRAAPPEKSGFSPMSPETVSGPGKSETIHTYSPEILQQQRTDAPIEPAVPAAAVPPLRGMNTQRRISPPYGTIDPQRQRRDSGTAMGTFGSPFQTPEKKPQITNNKTASIHATYHDATTLDSLDDVQNPVPQTLTPARYDPANTVAPSAAALEASNRLGKAQHGLPSSQPTIPPRPKRPETQISDFDFDEGLNDHEPRAFASPPREAYQSQVMGNPYATQARANPSSTFDKFLPGQTGNKSNDKHATNGTTFTTMLRNVGFPDPGDQIPSVPKLDVKRVRENLDKGKAKGTY